MIQLAPRQTWGKRGPAHCAGQMLLCRAQRLKEEDCANGPPLLRQSCGTPNISMWRRHQRSIRHHPRSLRSPEREPDAASSQPNPPERQSSLCRGVCPSSLFPNQAMADLGEVQAVPKQRSCAERKCTTRGGHALVARRNETSATLPVPPARLSPPPNTSARLAPFRNLSSTPRTEPCTNPLRRGARCPHDAARRAPAPPRPAASAGVGPWGPDSAAAVRQAVQKESQMMIQLAPRQT